MAKKLSSRQLKALKYGLETKKFQRKYLFSDIKINDLKKSRVGKN